MLYSERRRIAALEEREVAGESLWTRALPSPAREKIANVFDYALVHDYNSTDDWDRLHFAVCSARGVTNLRGISSRYDDTKAAIRQSEIDVVADLLESAYATISERGREGDDAWFLESINEILASYRISIELVAGRVVEFESKATHREIVVPTLVLLGGDSRFAGAEAAFQDALREVANDLGAADAVTDAGTCLQEVLVALGCKGNALGPLLKDARKKGILGGSDEKLAEGLGNLIDWVSSDRSGNGDAHNARPALRADAWLTIHVVGALALRLAAGKPRSGA